MDHAFSETGTHQVQLTVDCGAFTQKATREVTVESDTMKSCQAHLEAGHTESGVYEIDPDGEGGNDPFEVYCEQEFAGGGWTRITPEIAHNKMNGNLIKIRNDTSGDDGVDDSYRPYARDGADDHLYYYDIDLGFSVDEMYLSNYEAKANASDDSTSETKYYGDWGVKFDPAWSLVLVGNNDCVGDIALGFKGERLISFTEEQVDEQCQNCILSFTNNNNVYKANTKYQVLRMGWYEGGGEHEGWYPWWDGYIYVR